MRSAILAAFLLVPAACAQSPQHKQSDQLREEARRQSNDIKQKGENDARPLDEQARALHQQAKQVGGYAGKRLDVQAAAMSEQAKLVRKQAHEQGSAVREAADARIKALESR